MDEANRPQDDPTLQRLLEPGERIQHATTAGEALLAVTDRRIAVVQQQRTALDVAIDGLRRIQFDIEKARPATLVIVPEHAEHAEHTAQVLSIAPSEYGSVTAALATIGHRLAAAG